MNDDVRRFYDAEASHYDDDRWQSIGGRLTARRQTELVSALLAPLRSSVAIEVGCGTGRFSPLVARTASSRLFLIDLSMHMLSRSSKRLAAQSIDTIAVQASTTSIPFADQSVDLVVSLNVLNHVRDLDRAFTEFGRVIRKGGHLVVNFANLASLYAPAGVIVNLRGRSFRRDVYSRWRRPDAMAAAAESAGFVVLHTVGHFHVPHVVDRVPRITRWIARLDEKSAGPLGRLAPYRFVVLKRV